MQIIDTRTPFWVFICEYSDKPYQDILFDSDRDLLIVRSLSTGPAKNAASRIDRHASRQLEA
jgi:hypothetical protein